MKNIDGKINPPITTYGHPTNYTLYLFQEQIRDFSFKQMYYINNF